MCFIKIKTENIKTVKYTRNRISNNSLNMTLKQRDFYLRIESYFSAFSLRYEMLVKLHLNCMKTF